MVSNTAENLQAYSYIHNEYACKFSAVLKTIWSFKTGSPQVFSLRTSPLRNRTVVIYIHPSNICGSMLTISSVYYIKKKDEQVTYLLAFVDS